MLRHFLPALIVTISAISCKKDKGQKSPAQSKETPVFVTYRCAQDMQTIQEGAQCCFRGQTFRGSSCQGTPVCPVGMRAEHDTCVWEMKNVRHEPPAYSKGQTKGLMHVEKTQDEHNHTRLSVTVPNSSAFPDVISELNLTSIPHGVLFDASKTRLYLDRGQAIPLTYDAHYDFIWDTDWIRDVDTLYLANCTQIHPSKLVTFLRSSDVSKLVLEHNVHVQCSDMLFSFLSQQDDLGQLTSLKLEGDIAYSQTMRDPSDENLDVIILKPSNGFQEYVSSPLFHQLKSLEISGDATHEELARVLKDSPLAPSLTSFLLRSAHIPDTACSQHHDNKLIEALLTRNASRHLEHIRLVYPQTQYGTPCSLQGAFNLLSDAHIERIRTLTVSHPSLGDEAVKGIFSRQDLHHIETLSFSSSSLTASIFHALPKSAVISQVQELNLSYNALRGRDFPDPKHTEQVDSSLQRFNVSHNAIDARAMTWFLCRGMLSRVRDLNLSKNLLLDSEDWHEPEHCEHPYMHALRKLSLRGTAISVDGLRWFARHGLGEVEELDLSYNRLNDEALKVLIEEVDWKRLRILNLSHNKLTDVSLGALAKSRLLLKLRELDLSYNLFMGEDVSTGSHPLSYPLLRRLDLSHNPWTTRGYKMMFTLPWFNHVNHVSMISSSDETTAYDWSQIFDVAARASLHPAILTIEDKHLSDAALAHLSQVSWLRHIKELHLQGSFSGDTLSKLADSLNSGNLVYLKLKSSHLLPEHAGKLAYHANMRQLKHVDIDYDPLSHDENDAVLIDWLSSPQTHSLKSLDVTTLCSKVYEDHGAYIYSHLSPYMQEDIVAKALSQRTQKAALISWIEWTDSCPDIALMKTLASSKAIDPFLRQYYRFRINMEVMRQKSYKDNLLDSH